MLGYSEFTPTVTAPLPEVYKSASDIYNTDMKKTVWGIANDNTLDLGNWSSLSEDQKAKFTPEQQNFIQNNMQATPWYKDYGMISSFANLGSALGQLASLPAQYKVAQAQTKALQQNMNIAREEQDRRNKNIASFNRPRATTSAMV
jgi:hypothetical protein